MAAPAPAPYGPFEHAPGKSNTRWWLGFLGIPIGIAIGGTLLVSFWAIWWLDPNNWYPIRDAGLTQEASNLVVLSFFIAMLLWGLFVPIPAQDIYLTPTGIMVGLGRKFWFPWARVYRFGKWLYTFGRPWGIPSRFELTPLQAERVDWFLRRQRQS